MKKGPKIQTLDLVVDAVRGTVSVELTSNGTVVGEVTAYDVDVSTLTPSCRRALRSVQRVSGFSLTPYVVFVAKIPAPLQGSGIGTAMYLAAAEGAARLGGALIQHACFFDPEDGGHRGVTSQLAAQVWRGGRFQEHARVHGGRVAFMPSSRWGAGRSMVQFGQLEVLVNDNSRRKNPCHGEFGRALKEAVETPAAERVVDRHKGIAGTTWTTGSCMVLALALKRWFPPFRVVGVAWHGEVHHVLVECNGLYFDSDGVSTRHQMTGRWREHEKEARVIWLDTPAVKHTEITNNSPAIPSPPEAVAEVFAFIERKLGSPADWGLTECRSENPGYRLSGASASCYETNDARVCMIDTDDGRPVNVVQLRQLLLEEAFDV